MSDDPRTRRHEEVDSYNETVYALIALGEALTHDASTGRQRAGCDYGIGRRMETPPGEDGPQQTVTPDIALLRRPRYGIVAEAKISFKTGDAKNGGEHPALRQVMKYDADLVGWPSSDERVDSKDVALLVHYSRKADLLDEIARGRSEGWFTMASPFAGITFCRINQAKESMSFDVVDGALSDTELTTAMRPLFVPLEAVLAQNGRRLYDACPPMPLLLELMWDHVFSSLVDVEEYSIPGKRRFEIVTTVDEVQLTLAQLKGDTGENPRQIKTPRRGWVKAAMDLLVKMQVAVSTNKKKDEYRVKYGPRKKALDFFVTKILQLQAKKAPSPLKKYGPGKSKDAPGQLGLFK